MLIKLPDFDFSGGDIGRIMEFYKVLGWNGEDSLNPKRYILNTDDAKEILNVFLNSFPKEERKMANFCWLNYGPAVKPGVKRGYIKVIEY